MQWATIIAVHLTLVVIMRRLEATVIAKATLHPTPLPLVSQIRTLLTGTLAGQVRQTVARLVTLAARQAAAKAIRLAAWGQHQAVALVAFRVAVVQVVVVVKMQRNSNWNTFVVGSARHGMSFFNSDLYHHLILGPTQHDYYDVWMRNGRKFNQGSHFVDTGKSYLQLSFAERVKNRINEKLAKKAY
jgi:hypothetical protein